MIRGIEDGLQVTHLYGNYYYLFRSAYFWLCIPLTFFLAFTPRYILKAWKFGYDPDDIDIVRSMYKKDPHSALSRDAHQGIGLTALKRPASRASRRTSHTGSFDLQRPSVDPRLASRTDMATGLVSVDRGFDFATEENGVAMRRMQSNLSERRLSSLGVPLSGAEGKEKQSFAQKLSLRRGLRRTLKRKSS